MSTSQCIICTGTYEKNIMLHYEHENNYTDVDGDYIKDCHYDICKLCIAKYAIDQCGNYLYKKPFDDFDIVCIQYGCTHRTPIKDCITEEQYNMTGKQITIKLQHCPTLKCNGTITIDKCDECNLQFCLKCQQTLHEGDCAKHDIDALHTLYSFGGEDVNQCPKCNNIIFKNKGCGMMFCWGCSHSFDWNTNEIEIIFDNIGGKNYYDIYKTNREKGIIIRPEDFEHESDYNYDLNYSKEKEDKEDEEDEIKDEINTIDVDIIKNNSITSIDYKKSSIQINDIDYRSRNHSL